MAARDERGVTYTFREADDPARPGRRCVEVTKWRADRDGPLTVYRVYTPDGSADELSGCTCQGGVRHGHCKHSLEMVPGWQARRGDGAAWYYDQDAGGFVRRGTSGWLEDAVEDELRARAGL